MIVLRSVLFQSIWLIGESEPRICGAFPNFIQFFPISATFRPFGNDVLKQYGTFAGDSLILMNFNGQWMVM